MAVPALLVVDMQMLMQMRIDEGRDHVNGDAPRRVTDLLAAYRLKGWPVIHVWHHERDPASPMHRDAPAAKVMPCAEPLPGEPIFVKHTSSPFASTTLEDHLRGQGITDLLVTGAVAGFCVNTTVRAGSDLGFRMRVVRDAVMGFDLPDVGLPAQVIFDVTMAHLAADFAQLIDSTELLAG